MSLNHHILAKTTTDAVLSRFKSALWTCLDGIGADFSRIPTTAEFPSPDAAFFDWTNKIQASFEFKPPTETKRGILTGVAWTDCMPKAGNCWRRKAIRLTATRTPTWKRSMMSAGSPLRLPNGENGIIHQPHTRPLNKYDHPTFIPYLEAMREDLLTRMHLNKIDTHAYIPRIQMKH